MRTLPICLIALASAAAVAGPLAPGDRWLYQSVSQSRGERGPVVETNQVPVVVEGYANPLGKPVIDGPRRFGMHSDTCLVDIAVGVELPGEVPCDAPLTPGYRWYGVPIDPFQGAGQWFTVTGSATLTMGAKAYQATVISTIAPLIWASGYRRSTYWYVPAVKGMMKIVHEGMDEQGVVTVTETFTLLSFQPASDQEN